MKTATLKKELHNAIDCIDDNTILEAVYTLLNKNVYEYELSKEQKKELDRRLELLDKGDAKGVPYKKALKEIRDKLKRK